MTGFKAPITYTIYLLSNSMDDKTYIGASKKYADEFNELCWRVRKYAKMVKDKKDTKRNKLMDHILQVNLDNVRMDQLETVVCNSMNELNAAKRKHIMTTKSTLNHLSCEPFDKEKYRKEYWQSNKQEIQAKRQTQDYKEKQRLIDKKYRQINQEKIDAQRYQRVQCECGEMIRKCYLLRHNKTEIHKQMVSSKESKN
jgi:hypothetical protein